MAKRQSILAFINQVCGPSTTLARFGFGNAMRYELRKAYRIGLNNGKLLAEKRRGSTSGERHE